MMLLLGLSRHNKYLSFHKLYCKYNNNFTSRPFTQLFAHTEAFFFSIFQLTGINYEPLSEICPTSTL